jgi:hypothetical protein
MPSHSVNSCRPRPRNVTDQISYLKIRARFPLIAADKPSVSKSSLHRDFPIPSVDLASAEEGTHQWPSLVL